MANIKRSGFSVIKLVIVIAVIAVLFTAMIFIFGAAQTALHQQKWNDMVISKSKETKTVFLDKVFDPFSSQANISMVIDDKDEINGVLDILKDLSFTKIEDYEINKLNYTPVGADYRLILMQDDMQKESSNLIVGKTPYFSADLLTLYIDKVEDAWYAVAVVHTGLGYEVYISNAEPKLAELGEMYEAFDSSRK